MRFHQASGTHLHVCNAGVYSTPLLSSESLSTSVAYGSIGLSWTHWTVQWVQSVCNLYLFIVNRAINLLDFVSWLFELFIHCHSTDRPSLLMSRWQLQFFYLTIPQPVIATGRAANKAALWPPLPLPDRLLFIAASFENDVNEFASLSLSPEELFCRFDVWMDLFCVGFECSACVRSKASLWRRWSWDTVYCLCWTRHHFQLPRAITWATGVRYSRGIASAVDKPIKLFDVCLLHSCKWRKVGGRWQ